MNWQEWVLLGCLVVSLGCKMASAYLNEDTKARQQPLNRQQRRHPNGYVPARKFKTVNVGRQKQGNNKAIKNW